MSIDYIIERLTAPIPIQVTKMVYGIDDIIIIIVIIVIAIALAAVALALQSKPNPKQQTSPGETQRPTNDPSKSIGIVMGRALVKNPMVADYKETGADPLFVDQQGKK